MRPMLAKATTGVQEVLDKFSGIEFTCEYKYDGERTQVGGVCCREGVTGGGGHALFMLSSHVNMRIMNS